MKRNLIILIAALPILGMTWHFFSRGPQKTPLPAATSGTQAQPMREANSSEKGDKASSRDGRPSYPTAEREAARDQLTLRLHDHAQEATKLKPSDFGKNGDFLLKKHQALFDSWGLSAVERKKFVAVLSENSVRMAEIALNSAKAWPLEVGHVANNKSDAKHVKKKVEAYRKVEEDIKAKLTALVGADRVAEFEKERMGGRTETRD
jgi:hypothetical protein